MNAICLCSPVGTSVFVGFPSCFHFTRYKTSRLIVKMAYSFIESAIPNNSAKQKADDVV
jgi:hypothetical protein